MLSRSYLRSVRAESKATLRLSPRTTQGYTQRHTAPSKRGKPELSDKRGKAAPTPAHAQRYSEPRQAILRAITK